MSGEGFVRWRIGRLEDGKVVSQRFTRETAGRYYFENPFRANRETWSKKSVWPFETEAQALRAAAAMLDEQVEEYRREADRMMNALTATHERLRILREPAP